MNWIYAISPAVMLEAIPRVAQGHRPESSDYRQEPKSDARVNVLFFGSSRSLAVCISSGQ